MTTKSTPQLPLTFWKQLLARWAEDNPKFFEVYKKYNWVAIGIVGTFTFLVEVVFPDMFEVPVWLTLTNRYMSAVVTFLVGFLGGNVTTANITIATPDTPPLITKPEPPKPEEVLQQVLARLDAIEGKNKPTSQL